MKQTRWENPGDSGEFMAHTVAILENHIAQGDSAYLDDILKHPLQVKGQMIRPFLAFATAMAVNPDLAGVQMARLEHFAAAIELLHNASLIHDDVLDEEETRRGSPCLHRVFGEKNAILAGNIYYIKAIELATRHTGTQLTLRLLETAAKMCSGEILQQQFKDDILPDDVYFDIISRKTASLTAVVCRGAAEIAGADGECAGRFEQLGEWIGMIYQLQDDLKDGDARLREGFDLGEHLHRLRTQVRDLLQQLPPTGYLSYFDGFVRRLGGAA